MKSTGETFPLDKNEDILKINSPRNRLSGPYAVVLKNIGERWVIVALGWDGKTQLGIR